MKQVLHFRPDSAEAHFAMAGVFRAEELPKLEKEELNTALRLKPDLLGARLALARNLLRANQAKPALEILDKAPEAQQNIAGLAIERNWALLAAGDTKEVERRLNLYLKARRIPELVLQEAVLKMDQHDCSAAHADAEEVLKANPEDVRAARIIAASYARKMSSAKPATG